MSAHIEIFEQLRPRLFRHAYNMLGRIVPAEDAVQETFIRWQKQEQKQINSPEAYLVKVIHRICLDELKSARNQRETYVGPDLPEPVVTDVNSGPEESLELDELLTIAVLTVLDRLTPTQRSVYILREVFDYEYASISEWVDQPEEHCRKIAQRAREKVGQNQAAPTTQFNENKRLAEALAQAIAEEDVDQIQRILAEDAVLYSDGGGKVAAARKPIFGAGNISRFLAGIYSKATKDIQGELKLVNGNPGFIVRMDGKVSGVWSFQVDEGRIRNIFITLNPDKLKSIERDVDYRT